MNDEITYLATSEIDRQMALLLVDASIQAYNAFDPHNPDRGNLSNVDLPLGYELVDSWTGVDSVCNRFQQVECYGLILRSQKEPYTYIFAFRGTSGMEDLCDDFCFHPVSFQPYENSEIVPPGVRVESGFHHIYTNSHLDTPSMQQQLFAAIDKYQASAKPIDRLYITGHSLGCTLGTLFALDLALSRSEITVFNYNYASPRVGNQEFVDFYQQQSLAMRTIRFQNVCDKVPRTPLKMQGYKHLPRAFAIAFYRDNFTGKMNILDNHSVENYKIVLEYIFSSSNDCYDLVFVGDRDREMKSVKPDINSTKDFR